MVRQLTALSAIFAFSVTLAACEDPELLVPTAQQVEGFFIISAQSEIQMSGNVAVIEVRQSADHLRRGGTTWAKATPYIYLFSQATMDLFREFNGLAAVRVRTRTASGEPVAEATLLRDELNDITWKRALALAGEARVKGTQEPGTMSTLIRYGEGRTEHEYNPAYTTRR